MTGGTRLPAPVTNTGIPVANLRVAVNQRIQQDGEWRDGDTWRGHAEHLTGSVSRVDRVMVTRAAVVQQGGAGRPAGRD